MLHQHTEALLSEALLSEALLSEALESLYSDISPPALHRRRIRELRRTIIDVLQNI